MKRKGKSASMMLQLAVFLSIIAGSLVVASAQTLHTCNVCNKSRWRVRSTNHSFHDPLTNISFTCAEIGEIDERGELLYTERECKLMQASVFKFCECLPIDKHDVIAAVAQSLGDSPAENPAESSQESPGESPTEASGESLGESHQESAAESPIDFPSLKLNRGVPDAIVGKDIALEGGRPCNFVGKITMGGAFSLGRDDRLRSISHSMLVSEELVVDHVNRVRCGIHMSSGNYAIDFITYDDHSLGNWTTAISNHLVQKNVDIMLGGYSTTMTAPMAAVAAEHNKLMIAPGSSLSRLYVNRSTVFAIFPPSTNYMSTATRALAEKQVGPPVKKIAVFWENSPFFRSACSIIPSVAAEYGIEITSFQEITNKPNSTELDSVANQLLEEQPDVVMSCILGDVCSPWVKAMRKADLNPGAWVSSGQCVGVSSVHDELESDADFLLGGATWDPSLDNVDNATGWSSAEYARIFRLEKGDTDIPFHAASAASAISLAVQAIEGADTLDVHKLAGYISNNTFQTVYGEITFDKNGQNTASGLLLQWDEEGLIDIVYPSELASAQIVYPMPTWAQRDCKTLSRCESSGNNTCDVDGRCNCSSPHLVTAGLGETAVCVQRENFNYISNSLIIAGNVLASVVIFGGFVCLVWTYLCQDIALIKASQPIFLGLIVLGALISSVSILFMGYQTGYRDSDDIGRVDAACMAVPWLWGMGFAFMFSALFAKVWRVKKVVGYSAAMRRQTVKVKDVMYILVIMVSVEMIILLVFQLVSPLRWERQVIVEIDTFAIESAGLCDSELGWRFMASLVSVNVIFLLYALVLCYQTRHIHSDFAESGHIFLVVMFLFQVMVLVVPVSALVWDQPDVFYFIRAVAVFLQNFTVLAIIFGPKMVRTSQGQENLAASARRISAPTKSKVSRNSLSRNSYSSSHYEGYHSAQQPVNSNGSAQCSTTVQWADEVEAEP